MSDLSRVEQLLRNALGEDIYEVTPQSRVEALLVELNELIEGMGGSVSPEDIATAVAAYLDEHLTNPTNPPVDTSLSISGAAADAKKTGDELSDLKEGLSAMSTATSSDVGKALKAKTVTDGKVTEWEFGTVGSPTDSALSPTSENPVQNKVINGTFGNLASLSQYGSNVADILSYIINEIENPIDPNDIDVCLFAGQSNMDGRGTAEDATPVTTGKAFKWDNANNTVIDFAAEPSLIPAYMQEYTSLARVPLVEVKEAIGGTDIEAFINNYFPSAITKLSNCLTYLQAQGKNARRVFMLWNQGENDTTKTGLTSLTAEEYEAFFATLKSSVMQAGVEQIFVINIGQTNDNSADFTQIRTALQNVCNGTDVIMVSDKFYKATDYMNSQWHYTQLVYNVVGKDSADNTLAFYNGQTPNIKHFDSSDALGIPIEYGTLDDWTYTLVNNKVRLDAYNGSNPNVRVYHQYLLDGYFYEARIMSSRGSGYNACFTGNTTIESVVIDDGVRLMNPSNNLDANNQQSFSRMWEGCTNLQSVALSNNELVIVVASTMFKGCSNDVQFNFLSQINGQTSNMITNSGVTALGNITSTYAAGTCNGARNLITCGNISGTYNSLQSAFQNCVLLESVGTLASTAVTNINSAFSNCFKLKGVVRFESSNISSANNAFSNCDLTQIIIQCPANSTTYTTLSTAYPTANIVTF